MDLLTVQKLGVAAGLGLLVGFQREWTAPHVAGLRTFALITVLGTVIGLFAGDAGGWLISAGLIAVAAMIIVGNVVKFGDAEEEPGLTTQAAALVMYLVGIAIALDRMTLGIIVAGGTAVLLHWKEPKKIMRLRHSGRSEPKTLSRWAFKFGLRGGNRNGLAPSFARKSRKAWLHLASRSMRTTVLPSRKPSSQLVSSQATCFIQVSSGLVVQPAK